MAMNRVRTLWTEQCAATHTIRTRFGPKAALDYLVTEKLFSFADAAASHVDVARELPVFVAEVRRIFTADEIARHLAALERQWAADAVDAAEFAEDGLDDEEMNDPPEVVVARAERFATIKDLLLAIQLGIS
jgi:hypothetical protein